MRLDPAFLTFRTAKSLCLAAIFFFAVTGLINVHLGASDLQLLQSFDADEAWTVQRVHNNILHNDLNPRGHYIYGYAYETLGVGALKIFQALRYEIDPQLIAVFLRTFSAFLTVLSFLLLLKIIRQCEMSVAFFSPLVLLILGFPDFYYWAHHIHPDILQLVFVLLAFCIAFSDHSLRSALFASLFIGFAFGTKYSGLHALPFVLVPYLLRQISLGEQSKKRILCKALGVSLLSLLTCVLGFVAFNHQALVHRDDFLKAMKTLKLLLNAEWTHNPGSPLQWFTAFDHDLGVVGTSIVLLGVALFLVKSRASLFGLKTSFRQRVTSPVFRNYFTLCLYSISGTLLLFFFMKTRYTRYMYHVLPFLVLLSVDGYARLFSSQRKQGVVALLLTLAIFANLPRTLEMARADSTKSNHARLAHVPWLENNYCASTHVIADDFTYTPKKFHHRLAIPRGSVILDMPTADVLVAGIGHSGKYVWKKPNTTFQQGQFEVRTDNPTGHQMLENLQKFYAGRTPYHLVFENDHVLIFENRSIVSNLKTCR